MIQIFMCSKVAVTKVEVEEEGEAEEAGGAFVDGVAMVVVVEGAFVDVAEATVHIELHWNTDSA